MEIILSAVRGTQQFVFDNYQQIVLAVIIFVCASASLLFTIYSLRSLKEDIFSYYPFDRFYPGSQSWSIWYFLAVVAFLLIIIYLASRGGFYHLPA